MLLPLIIQYFSHLRPFLPHHFHRVSSLELQHRSCVGCSTPADTILTDAAGRRVCRQSFLPLRPRVTRSAFVFSRPPSLPRDWSASSRQASRLLVAVGADFPDGGASCQCAPEIRIESSPMLPESLATVNLKNERRYRKSSASISLKRKRKLFGTVCPVLKRKEIKKRRKQRN